MRKIGKDPAYPLNGEYELAQDIDATVTKNWNNGAGFAPIGNWGNPFTGKFDGNGHKIKGLYINRPGAYGLGLFCCIDSGGEVKNLGLEDVMVSGGNVVGGLVGCNASATVSACDVTGAVSGGGGVGGLVGLNTGTLSDCWTSCKVSGRENVGGLVGCNNSYGKISRCYVSGTVSGDWYAGGLIGKNDWDGTVNSCYVKGSVSGDRYVGGLVGYNGGGTINNCYVSGSVTGSNYIGGLVGYLEWGRVTNTYSTSSIDGRESNKGGLVGYICKGDFSIVTNSYWDTETSGMSTSAVGIGRTTADMKQRSNFVDWDFENVWGIDNGKSYPHLLWQCKSKPQNVMETEEGKKGKEK